MPPKHRQQQQHDNVIATFPQPGSASSPATPPQQRDAAALPSSPAAASAAAAPVTASTSSSAALSCPLEHAAAAPAANAAAAVRVSGWGSGGLSLAAKLALALEARPPQAAAGHSKASPVPSTAAAPAAVPTRAGDGQSRLTAAAVVKSVQPAAQPAAVSQAVVVPAPAASSSALVSTAPVTQRSAALVPVWPALNAVAKPLTLAAPSPPVAASLVSSSSSSSSSSRPPSTQPFVAPSPSPLTGELISNKQRKKAAKEAQRQQLLQWEESQRMEVEALQSVYLSDLCVLSASPAILPSSPSLPSSLRITILPEPMQDRDRANHAVLSLTVRYPQLQSPLAQPQLQLDAVRGLDASLLEAARQEMARELQRLWSEDAAHDGVLVSLCSSLQDWLRQHNVESFALHEEMQRREQRREEERERQQRLQAERLQQEERQRMEKLALDIQEANRRKEQRAMEEEKGRRSSRLQPAAAPPPPPPAPAAATSSAFHSPLPHVEGLKRQSSGETKVAEAGEGRRVAAAHGKAAVGEKVGAKETKAQRAKQRQQEARDRDARRRQDRTGKQRQRREDEELSTSNPLQLLNEDGEKEQEDDNEGEDEDDDDDDDEASSASAGSDEADNDNRKEESQEQSEDAESLFPSVFSGTGGLSFFDQKKKNERDLLAELDRRERSGDGQAEDSDSEASSASEAEEEDVRQRKTGAGKKGGAKQLSPSKASHQASSSLSSLPVQAASLYSRYRSDFEELQLLGRGGFGAVFKVRHRVDSLLYAVKRIPLPRRRPEESRKVIREVSTIGMLHHTYIVRYYGAWLEEEDEADGKERRERRLQQQHQQQQQQQQDWPLHADDAAEAESDWLSSSYTRSSYPPDDDDEEEEDDAGQEADAGRRRSSRGSSQLLYIQMELCAKKTLKDAIADGLCQREPEACWRLFRQMLEAVAYIHSRDIMHRDLKPANVFIDMQGNVKLGDFGLAVLMGGKRAGVRADDGGDREEQERRAQDEDDANALSKESVVREVVGTVFYRSPEQEAEGREYDQTADMWALGVILLEMFQPFGSASERVAVLSEVRRTHRVPADFMRWAEDAAQEKKVGERGAKDRERERERERERREERRQEREKVTSIIHQLLHPSASSRPSAAALLRSGLIPLKMEDEYVEMSLRLLSLPDSPHRSRLMEQLFAQQPDPLLDYTYDYLSSSSSSAPSQLHLLPASNSFSTPLPLPLSAFQLYQQRVFDVAAHHFRLHGATLLSTQLILPKTSSGQSVLTDAHSQQVLLMDDSGLLLKLPYTLTIPFARFIAQNAAADGTGRGGEAALQGGGAWLRNGLSAGRGDVVSFDLRRFDMAKVYRKNPVGGRPREVYEVDFDCVWPNALASAAAAAASTASGAADSGRKELEVLYREKRLAVLAECVKLTLDIVSHFSYALGPVLVRVNHHTLVDAVMRAVLPPPAAPSHAELLSLLYRLSSHFSLLSTPFARSSFRKQLLKNLSERQVDWLGACLTLRADHTQLDLVLDRVRELLSSAPETRTTAGEAAKVEEALAELRLLYEMLRALGVAEYVVLDLGLTGKRELYAGAITFQAFMHAREPAAGPHSSRLATSPSAPTSSSLAFDPVAVGGCYDSLLASFLPPNASTVMNGVGCNLAVEKILSATIDCHLQPRAVHTFPSFAAFFASSSLHAGGAAAIGKGKRGKRGSVAASGTSSWPSSLFSAPSSSIRPESSLPPPVSLSSSSLPCVLLYSPKHHLLHERLSLASLLWTSDFPCLYLTPALLSLSSLFSFLRLHGVRFLVLMRRRQWKENGVLELIDMEAVQSQRRWDRLVTRIRGRGGREGDSERKREGDRRETAAPAAAAEDEQRERERDGIEDVLISEILAVLRSRAANIRREESEAVGHSSGNSVAAGQTASSSAAASSLASSAHLYPHSHPHAHSSASASASSASSLSSSATASFHIHVVDPAAAIKREAKPNIITAARRAIAPLLTAHTLHFAVAVAVDLPISQLRGLGTAYVEAKGGRGKAAAAASVDVDVWVAGVAGRWREAMEAVWEHIRKRQTEASCDVCFLFSITDRKLDVLLL